MNYIIPEGTKAIFEVTVGKSSSVPTSRYFVSKEKPLKIYNGVSTREYEDQYIVRWRGSTGSDGTGSLTMKERRNGASIVTDTFVRTNSSEVSMDSLLTNVGIYFSNAGSVLGQDGWINVYNDETNELIYTFTAENWNNYDANNPYTYSTPVKHIRIETSNVNKNSTIYVYNVKEIDDTKLRNTYSKSEFDNLSYIRSNLVGYLNGSEINTDTETAVYEEPRTEVSLGVGNSMISTQVTEKNLINITASSDKNSNLSGWTNGVFLVKIPSTIIDLQINYVESSNSEVEIANYELYEENGEKFIKIITTSNDAGRFAIAVDVNMTADPRKISESGELELYAYNESCDNFTISTADIYEPVFEAIMSSYKVNSSVSVIDTNVPVVDICFKDIPIEELLNFGAVEIVQCFGSGYYANGSGGISYDKIEFYMLDDETVGYIWSFYPECFSINGNTLSINSEGVIYSDEIIELLGSDYEDEWLSSGYYMTYYYPTYALSFGINKFSEVSDIRIYNIPVGNSDTSVYSSGDTLAGYQEPIENYYKLSGAYAGITGQSTLSVSIYSAQEEGEVEIGNAEIYSGNGQYYFGTIIPTEENVYKVEAGTGEEVLLVETESSEGIVLQLYVDGQYLEEYRMTEHYES